MFCLLLEGDSSQRRELYSSLQSTEFDTNTTEGNTSSNTMLFSSLCISIAVHKDIREELSKLCAAQASAAAESKRRESLSPKTFLESHEKMIKIHGELTRNSVMPVVKTMQQQQSEQDSMQESTQLQESPVQCMTRVEKAIFGQSSTGPLLHRLRALEEAVFGDAKTGALTTRVQSVLSAAAAFMQ